MSPRRLAAVLTLCLVGACVAAAGAAAADGNVYSRVTGPNLRESWTATLILSTAARARPDSQSRVVKVLRAQTLYTGAPHRFLVLQRRTDPAGQVWVRLRLPQRPNGLSAWVRADYVRLARNPWRIVVDRSERRISVYRNGRLRLRSKVVVGAPQWPTPVGTFAIYDVFRPVEWPGEAFTGNWVITLTAHSSVLETFGGGPGVTALHGRGGSSFNDPLGSAASHGCVRGPNDVMSWIVKRTKPGTPVIIRA
jgi:lipoprotein-anchoring transpeptidase ErfK/SrfK